ncbi:hypothetical protein J2N86_10720 [Legionella lytica]|uniref:Transmembrane protein n=1 Tax=Legionella lytica TaxID=96232 RepID=A0ABY4Y6B1_9GAMM|nr:hypothetical protein [Legionella lytica]USQ13158.1 hypothetical protein J2N86_10720 [Legionella lytica]
MITLYNYFQFAKTAMTIGLLVAAGLLFWPGALATVANFSLFGLSIAAYVGSNVLYQAGAVAALTFVGLHALGITMDVVGGFFSLLKSCCCSSRAQEEDYPTYRSHQARAPQAKQDSYQMFNQAMPPSYGQHVAQTQSPPSYQTIYQQPSQPSYQPIYPQLGGHGNQQETYSGYPKLQ